MLFRADWYTTALIRFGKRLDSICVVRSLARARETLIENGGGGGTFGTSRGPSVPGPRRSPDMA